MENYHDVYLFCIFAGGWLVLYRVGEPDFRVAIWTFIL